MPLPPVAHAELALFRLIEYMVAFIVSILGPVVFVADALALVRAILFQTVQLVPFRLSIVPLLLAPPTAHALVEFTTSMPYRLVVVGVVMLVQPLGTVALPLDHLRIVPLSPATQTSFELCIMPAPLIVFVVLLVGRANHAVPFQTIAVPFAPTAYVGIPVPVPVMAYKVALSGIFVLVAFIDVMFWERVQLPFLYVSMSPLVEVPPTAQPHEEFTKNTEYKLSVVGIETVLQVPL